MSKIITDINQLDLNKIYTYADYLLWQFSERVELIKGLLYKMSPAPNVLHQKILQKINTKINRVMENHPCNVFFAPLDVVLYDVKKAKKNPENANTVVQPDLCIICDEEKLADGKKCVGAPDLIIEILSPGNNKKEVKLKYDLYQENGVKEYWVVYPYEEIVMVYELVNDKYVALPLFASDDEIQSKLFPQIKFSLGDVFVSDKF